MKTTYKIYVAIIALIVAATLTMCAISFDIPHVAHANSAQHRFRGVDAMGTVMRGESPIVVEHEQLTFDLATFPSVGKADEFASYDGKVTAEYTFYNPSEYTVTATLLFPFGRLPEYYFGWDYLPDDTDRYDITVNGERVEKHIRYTLCMYDEFNVNEQLSSIGDDYADDDFFSPDMPVTRYDFTMSGVDVEKYHAACASFSYAVDGRKLVFPGNMGMKQEIGTCTTGTWIDKADGEQKTVYVIGAPFDEFPKWTFYKTGEWNDNDVIDGNVTLNSTETFTLEEFVLADRDEASPISKTDWYNAAVALLNLEGQPAYTSCFKDVFDSMLIRWYEYDITIQPDERLVNTVTAPIYPLINSDYDPPKYEYTYLLSPASTWKSFGSINIVINTPAYLLESTPEGFTQTDGGYTLSLDGLPDSELTFTLCASTDPQLNGSIRAYNFALIMLVLAILIPIAVIGIGGIVAIIVVCVHVSRKKNHS